MKYIILLSIMSCMLASVLLAGIIYAQEDVQAEKRNDYAARLEHIDCRIDLTKKQIDLLSSMNETLIEHKNTLDTDYAKLKESGDALNHTAFRYAFAELRDDLKETARDIREVKKDIRTMNKTKEERKVLRENHQTLMREFVLCLNETENKKLDSRIAYLNRWITRWNGAIEEMKAKGYNTSEMESVVMDAQEKLIPAIEALKNSTTENRKMLMEEARSLHLHLWARFQIARVRSYLSSIESDAIAKGYQAEVDAIKTKLNTASTLAVEGKKYGPGEFETTWKTIREATRMLKELNKKLKA